MPPAPVVLDWDNTLHDAAATYLRVLRKVLAEHGITLDEATYRAAYTTDYPTLYRRLGLDAGRIAGASDRWRSLLREEMPRLLPGAGDALRALRIAGCPIALVTSGPREVVEPQLSTLGLRGAFAVVVYGDGQRPRPDPAPLAAALAALGTAATDAAYLSDTPDDMRMGVAAGAWTVGVTSFAHGPDALVAAGADEVTPSFAAWARTWLRGGAAAEAGEGRR